MDILENIDCTGCESYRRYRGRAWGDPDRCCPPETICAQDAPDSGLCDRMAEAICSMANDGSLVDILTSDFLLSEDGQDLLIEWGFQGRRYDFSSAPYWYIPVDSRLEPVPYADEKAVYDAWFI